MPELIQREVPLRASMLERTEDIAVRQRGRARRGDRIAASPAPTATAHGLTLDALASVVDQLRADNVPGDAPLVAAVSPSPFAGADEPHVVSIMAVVPKQQPATLEETPQS